MLSYPKQTLVEQICLNKNLLLKNVREKLNSGSLEAAFSRMFNDITLGEGVYFEKVALPYIQLLFWAIENKKVEVWIQLLSAFICNEIFDHECNIKQELQKELKELFDLDQKQELSEDDRKTIFFRAYYAAFFEVVTGHFSLKYTKHSLLKLSEHKNLIELIQRTRPYKNDLIHELSDLPIENFLTRFFSPDEMQLKKKFLMTAEEINAFRKYDPSIEESVIEENKKTFSQQLQENFIDKLNLKRNIKSNLSEFEEIDALIKEITKKPHDLTFFLEKFNNLIEEIELTEIYFLHDNLFNEKEKNKNNKNFQTVFSTIKSALLIDCLFGAGYSLEEIYKSFPQKNTQNDQIEVHEDVKPANFDLQGYKANLYEIMFIEFNNKGLDPFPELKKAIELYIENHGFDCNKKLTQFENELSNEMTKLDELKSFLTSEELKVATTAKENNKEKEEMEYNEIKTVEKNINCSSNLKNKNIERFNFSKQKLPTNFIDCKNQYFKKKEELKNFELELWKQYGYEKYTKKLLGCDKVILLGIERLVNDKFKNQEQELSVEACQYGLDLIEKIQNNELSLRLAETEWQYEKKLKELKIIYLNPFFNEYFPLKPKMQEIELLNIYNSRLNFLEQYGKGEDLLNFGVCLTKLNKIFFYNKKIEVSILRSTQSIIENLPKNSNDFHASECLKHLYAIITALDNEEVDYNKILEEIKNLFSSSQEFEVNLSNLPFFKSVSSLISEISLDKNFNGDKDKFELFHHEFQILIQSKYFHKKKQPLIEKNVEQKKEIEIEHPIFDKFDLELFALIQAKNLLKEELKTKQNSVEIFAAKYALEVIDELDLNPIFNEAVVDENDNYNFKSLIDDVRKIQEIVAQPTHASLNDLQQLAYKNAKLALTRELTQYTYQGSVLHEAAKSTADSVDELMMNRDPKTHDMKDITGTLVNTRKVLVNPLNIKAADNLHQHAVKLQTNRKLFGTVLCLLGVATFLASIAFGLFTFGLGTPLTIAGIHLGTGLMAAGVAMAVGGTGLALSITGASIFEKSAGKTIYEGAGKVVDVAIDENKKFKKIV